MEKITLYFRADKQTLEPTKEIPTIVSNTINYVDARFDLSDEWKSFDIVQAIFDRYHDPIATTVIDGYCIVPNKLLTNTGLITVNLVGSNIEDSELVARLTTASTIALKIKKNAYVDGGEDEKVTPSQFEEFVTRVEDAAENAVSAAEQTSQDVRDASDYKDAAQQAAEIAVASVQEIESIDFHIDEFGNLIFTKEVINGN